MDCEPPSGSTVRPKSVGTEVTFAVRSTTTNPLNPNLNEKRTTDASGVATFTWSRANPETDNVDVFPTSQPAVRASATIRWLVAAEPLAITPDDAKTLKDDTCRAYTAKTQSLTTGAAASRKVLLNFTENGPALTGTTDNDKGAFFKIPSNGANAGSPNRGTYILLSTDSTGTGTFDVCGLANVSVAVTPVGFYDESDNGGREAGEDIQDTGGKVTFETAKATITLTPDTAKTNATGGARQYTVTAVDQFGNAFLGKLDIGFQELTDDSITTTSSARIMWTKVGGSAPSTDGGCTGTPPTPPTVTSQPANTTTVNDTRTEVTFTVGNTTAFFAVCSTTNNDTGTPIAWQDLESDDNTRQTGEPQDTGGTKTWKTAAVTSASLSPADPTNASSTESPISNNGSLGEEKYTAKVVDQSGNQITPGGATTVVFTVRNTSSSGNVFITECNGTSGAGTISAGAHSTNAVGTTAGDSAGIPPGFSGTCTAIIDNTATATASVEIDKAAAGNATIDCTASVGTTTLVCNQTKKTWVDAGSGEPAGDASVTGDVVAFDKTADTYTVKATVGNFTLTYNPGDTFTVDNTVATPAQFETNITIGDSIKWSRTAAVEKHELTNK